MMRALGRLRAGQRIVVDYLSDAQIAPFSVSRSDSDELAVPSCAGR
jgi:hypothetical protein